MLPKARARSLDETQQADIRRYLVDKTPDQLKLDFALWTRAAVGLLIKERCGIDMPIRTVSKYLAEWGFTPQKPVKRAYQRCEKQVKTWMEVEHPKIAAQAKPEGAEIQWVDETDLSTADQIGRGYAPRGKTPVRKHPGRAERSNMISTVTNQGKVQFMFYEGTMNAKRLIEFLKRLIKERERKTHLILDNLRVHHAKVLKAWLCERRDQIEIHYLPSYSPDLNPDEFLNCDLKEEIGKRPEGKTKGNLKKRATSHMRRPQQSPKRVAKYFEAESIRYAA